MHIYSERKERQMKRILSILLAVLLIAAILPTAAFADGPVIVLSTQKLRVNGVTVDCERYNIDGSNYFKLRDLAYALNGTGSQFSVSWDGANKCVSLVSGEAYTPIGGELDPATSDKSAVGAPSGDKLIINGEDYSSLSAFKFEGANFYKLKELGDALGFDVAYDTASRTMIVVTKAISYPTPWLTVETVYNEDGAATGHSKSTYDEEGRTLTYLWEDEYGTESYAYTYDELGRAVSYTYDYVGTYGEEPWEEHSTTTYTYDMWGQLATVAYQSTGDVVSETNYTYDDDGRTLVEETLGNQGRTTYYSTYDEAGNLIRYACAYDDEVAFVNEYEYDAQGREIRSRYLGADGEVISTSETTYVSDLEQVGVYTSETYSSTSHVFYDENGNLIRNEWTDGTTTSVGTTIYDENNNILQDEYTSEDFSRVTVYTYNEAGLLVKEESSTSDNDYIVEEYTYDEAGNVLTDVYRNSGYTRTISYTYDPATRTKNILVLDTYEGVG